MHRVSGFSGAFHVFEYFVLLDVSHDGKAIIIGSIHYILRLLNFPVHIREVCVFLAPIFSGLTAIMGYMLTKELWNDRAGLFAACFLAIGKY